MSNFPDSLRDALRDAPDAYALERAWNALPAPPPAATQAEQDADWAALMATLSASETSQAPTEPAARRVDRAAERPPRRPARRARWIAPVAALVVVLGLVLALRPVAYTAAPGETLAVALPDGSTVELNSDSRLSHARFQTGMRRVRLDGEAYFDVVPGERPFVVETAEARVTVLGTAFNVRARAASGTTVAVAEGVVRVEAGTEAATLEAGDAVRADGRIASVASDYAMAWRTGGFAVQDEPLRGILRELERRYDLTIALENDDAARDALTLYFPRPPDAEAIVRDLATARDLRYRRTANGFTLY